MYQNARSPIFSNVPGRASEVTSEYSNARDSTERSESGSVRDASLDVAKAASPIVVVPAGTTNAAPAFLPEG